MSTHTLPPEAEREAATRDAVTAELLKDRCVAPDACALHRQGTARTIREVLEAARRAGYQMTKVALGPDETLEEFFDAALKPVYAGVLRGGSRLWMHACGNVELWPEEWETSEAVAAEVGCDACESAQGTRWDPLYVRVR